MVFRPSACSFLRNVVGIGKEQLVPGVAGPAELLARLIDLSGGLELLAADVPAHVDDEDVERHVVLVEAADELVEFLVGVSPSSATTMRRRRSAAAAECGRRPHEVAEGLAVVVAVAEEVPVLSRALAGGALHDPGPGAFFALQEAEVGGVEERAGGVVHQCPAGARDEARLDGLLVLSPSAPSRVRVVPCRFSGSARPGCQTTCLPST